MRSTLFLPPTGTTTPSTHRSQGRTKSRTLCPSETRKSSRFPSSSDGSYRRLKRKVRKNELKRIDRSFGWVPRTSFTRVVVIGRCTASRNAFLHFAADSLEKRILMILTNHHSWSLKRRFGELEEKGKIVCTRISLSLFLSKGTGENETVFARSVFHAN